ncbi:hypothetical protein [Algirhabdus cladophorae]|uniref:hypothetical protein n=1 Tax=Algirhabdus cladophorae TaxID=3377108 RepID=UPI003B8452E0
MQKLSRRHVLATLTGSAVLLCPALLNASTTVDVAWDDIPTDVPIGQDRIITVAGAADIDVSALEPGDVAVIGRPSTDPEYASTGMTQYIAVHRRTADQVASAKDRAGTVQNPEYFVVNLVCTHRGKAIGLTGNPQAPFACTDRGSRHSSVYDVSGFGVSGASEGEYLSVPAYSISTGATTVLSLS